MTKKDFIYLFIIGVTAVVAMQGCPKEKAVETTTTYNVKDTVITVTRDSVVFKPVKVTTYAEVLVPVYDTITKTREYINPIDDSLIGGNIQTTVKDGVMVSQKLNYIPKFPKFIYETRTVTIHDSTYVEKTINEKPKTQIALGFTGIYSSQPTIYGNILVKTKTNHIFGLGYDPFYKSVLLQYNKIITFKRK
jgi:hypothetical protein